MPHPKKHLKLTGDTHPPEVEDDPYHDEPGADEERAQAAPMRFAPAGIDLSTPARPVHRAATMSPLAKIGIALGAVWLLTRLARR